MVLEGVEETVLRCELMLAEQKLLVAPNCSDLRLGVVDQKRCELRHCEMFSVCQEFLRPERIGVEFLGSEFSRFSEFSRSHFFVQKSNHGAMVAV
ncbi:unnamed protein product [Microthlaspi erraticum]|uniref:Uncharacterized protein n=1 Tax=Microthlaspi erraticum TaxID=1685480 RepID=A0A6D2JFW6_9BRAS|nr:unnamed protein product [Microthlaspi erraticum]